MTPFPRGGSPLFARSCGYPFSRPVPLHTLLLAFSFEAYLRRAGQNPPKDQNDQLRMQVEEVARCETDKWYGGAAITASIQRGGRAAREKMRRV